jgi:hypothetical protein
MNGYHGLLVVLFVSALLFGCCGSSAVQKTGTPEPSGSLATQTPTPASPIKLELGLGETATSNGVAVTVKSAEIVDSYVWGTSGSSFTQNAPAGKKYLIATVSIKNVNTDASREVYANSYDFSATDAEGNAYDFTYGMMSDIFVVKSLFQNQKTEGTVLFEINDGAQNVSILYNFGNVIGGARLAEWHVS